MFVKYTEVQKMKPIIDHLNSVHDLIHQAFKICINIVSNSRSKSHEWPIY